MKAERRLLLIFPKLSTPYLIKFYYKNLYLGVPQGTVLGPLLLIIYVNDMQQMIGETSELVQYADDTMIYTSHGNIEEAISLLENEIDKLIHFCQCHRLTVNAIKAEFIIFCKP